MIRVDTAVWVDHPHGVDTALAAEQEHGAVRRHPFAVGEIACGSLRDRAAIRELLLDLPTAGSADNAELLGFVERHGLHGKSIGYVDAPLLASVALTQASGLWTHDKRLHAAAQDLGMACEGAGPHWPAPGPARFILPPALRLDGANSVGLLPQGQVQLPTRVEVFYMLCASGRPANSKSLLLIETIEMACLLLPGNP